jgi:hypothetical protein
MKTILVVFAVLFAGNAYAGPTIVCTTNGNVTTCVEMQPQYGY